MLKSSKPILLVAGDPKSVFLEIFFKSFKIQKFKNPLILIVSKKILIEQMKLIKKVLITMSILQQKKKI